MKKDNQETIYWKCYEYFLGIMTLGQKKAEGRQLERLKLTEKKKNHYRKYEDAFRSFELFTWLVRCVVFAILNHLMKAITIVWYLFFHLLLSANWMLFYLTNQYHSEYFKTFCIYIYNGTVNTQFGVINHFCYC